MSIPATQKALRLQSLLGSYAVDTVPVPILERGEVLVRVEAAALNPSDWKTRLTNYSMVINVYPGKQGLDAAGTVVQIGEGVTGLIVGDKIIHQGGYSDKLGGFQQYTAVSAELVAKVPENISLEEAATVPLNAVTAAVGLYHGRQAWGGGAGLTPFWVDGGNNKYAGRPILIFGGSSAVGQFAIQFAKLSGFSPIITTASPKYSGLLRGLGATHVIDRRLSPEQITAGVRAITEGPIRLIYDAISDPDTQNLAHDILAPGGVLVIVILDTIDQAKKTPDKEVILAFGNVHLGGTHRQLGVEIYQRISGWLATGTLKPLTIERIPGGLSSVPEAQERLRAGLFGARKLVVNPQEGL